MDVILTALGELFEPLRLALLVGGVLIGLVIGVVPGIGGIFGLTLLIPLTYTLDPYAAFALLLGMSSVQTTSDTIPAVLLGVPGTVGSMATIVDGHPLAKKSQAARAFGAAYTSSMIGGVFGALVLAASIPVMRPLVLLLNFGDLLAITLFGLTLVAILSARAPVKGLCAAILGVLASYIGLDPQMGVERWTFDLLYLWDGLPIAVVFLGLFAIPEVASLFVRGQAQLVSAQPEPGGLRRGIRDALREWRLILSSSSIGALLGAAPGIGASVIDWVAYGRATGKKGVDDVPFGEGNIRGVIAPESANNAKEGGSLIPTVALGVPGSAVMAILLGAFTIQGLNPGPSMLTTHAPILVAMVFTIALANILGAGVCLALTKQLAQLALVPARIIAPIVLVFVALGAFEANRDPMDFVLLIGFAIIGVFMKNLGWPRAAFALGFVLGPNLERFSFLTMQLDGWSWLTQPLVLILFAVAVYTLVRREIARRRNPAGLLRHNYPRLDLAFTLGLVALATAALVTATRLPFEAGIFPIVGSSLLLLLLLGRLAWMLLSRPAAATPGAEIEDALGSDFRFLLLSVPLVILILGIGHLAASAAFVLVCGLLFRGERPILVVVRAAGLALSVYALFDLIVGRPWPVTWLGF